jgi:hypothetical protein
MSWVNWGASLHIENLRQYATTIEELLRKKLDKFNAMVDKKASRIPAEELDDFYDYHGDTGWQLQEIFPEILRKSLFITTHSFLEHQLNQICKFFSDQQEYKLKISDLRHEGIIRAQVYLKKVVGIDFPDQTPTWSEIKEYNRIRNVFVHSEGKLNDSPKSGEIRAFIQRKGSIELSEDNTIRLGPTAIIEYLNVLEEFFNNLYDVIRQFTATTSEACEKELL